MYKNESIILFFFVLYCFCYFVLSAAIYYISYLNGNSGLGLSVFGDGNDGFLYAEQAKNVADGVPAVLTSIHGLVLGYLFKIFQTENIFLLKFFNYLGNILFGLVALLLLKKSTEEPRFLGNSAIILILLLSYYPSLLLNSTLSIYRDVWICFYYFLSVLLFAALFVVKGKSSLWLNICLLCISVLMLGAYRKYALLSFLIGSALYLFFVWQKNKKVHFGKIIFASLLGFSIAYTFLRSWSIPYVNLSFQTVLDYRQAGLEVYAGGSQMGISLDQPNILLFYLNYLYSFLSNIVGPLPWQVSGFATLLVFMSESILFTFILLFLYWKRKQFSKMDILLVIHSTVWFMLISISNDNLGTAARLRMVGWIPLFVIFAKHYGKHATLQLSKKDTGSKTNGKRDVMKVLLTASVFSHFTAFHVPYIKILQKKGCEVWIAADQDPLHKEKLEKMGVVCVNIPFARSPFSKSNVKAYKELKKLAKETKFSLVHTHTPVAAFLTRLVFHYTSAKILYTAHGFHFYKGAPLKNWLTFFPAEKLARSWTDGLIVMNKEDYQNAAKLGYKKSEVFFVHGVGVEIPLSVFDKEETIQIKKKLGLQENNLVVSFVAELNDNKNHQFLLRNWEAISTACPNAVLLIIGHGEKEKELREYSEKNLKNVHFLGYRTDVPDILKITDVLTLLSKREGLPKSIMEAMAQQIPCVVTNTRGLHDLVLNGENGFVVSHEDNSQLQKAFIELLQNEALRKKMAEKAGAMVESYDLKHVINEYELIYNKFLNNTETQVQEKR